MIVTESGHWYDQQGNPRYTIIGKNGKERNTTLRDARKEILVPSVTSVLKVKAAPGLEVWKQNQILLAAATLPKVAGESADDWMERVKQDAREQGKSARYKGLEIHGWLEKWFADEEVPDESEDYTNSVGACFAEHGFIPAHHEKSFTSHYGFGGKIDCRGKIGNKVVYVDYKTTEFDKDTKDIGYFDQCIQLSAYAYGNGHPEARIANVYVSTSEPGLVRWKEWTEADKEKGIQIFLHLLDIWKLERDYDPGKETS